jgi:hypothetical protein
MLATFVAGSGDVDGPVLLWMGCHIVYPSFLPLKSLFILCFRSPLASSLGFSSLSVLVVLAHDGLLMSFRALSVRPHHPLASSSSCSMLSFFSRLHYHTPSTSGHYPLLTKCLLPLRYAQASHSETPFRHQVQPLCYVVIEKGLEALIQTLSACIIMFVAHRTISISLLFSNISRCVPSTTPFPHITPQCSPSV